MNQIALQIQAAKSFLFATVVSCFILREMKPISSDTTPEAEAILIEGYRRMPVWKKLQQVNELTELVRQLAMNDIRRRHPQADERELRLRLASRSIEPELMRKAFGWDPDKEGY